MSPVDLVNSCFVAGGAVVIWANVLRLLRDRNVAGINLWGQCYYACWVSWSVAMYTAVGLSVSVVLAVLGAAGYWTWVLLAWRLRRG